MQVRLVGVGFDPEGRRQCAQGRGGRHCTGHRGRIEGEMGSRAKEHCFGPKVSSRPACPPSGQRLFRRGATRCEVCRSMKQARCRADRRPPDGTAGCGPNRVHRPRGAEQRQRGLSFLAIGQQCMADAGKARGGSATCAWGTREMSLGSPGRIGALEGHPTVGCGRRKRGKRCTCDCRSDAAESQDGVAEADGYICRPQTKERARLGFFWVIGCASKKYQVNAR